MKGLIIMTSIFIILLITGCNYVSKSYRSFGVEINLKDKAVIKLAAIDNIKKF